MALAWRTYFNVVPNLAVWLVFIKHIGVENIWQQKKQLQNLLKKLLSVKQIKKAQKNSYELIKNLASKFESYWLLFHL